MEWFYSVKLIRFFDFYLALIFLAGLILRIRQYRAVINLVRAMPTRWPKLLMLLKQYRHIFLTFRTIGPLALSLALFLIHTIVRRVVLNEGDALTVAKLLGMNWKYLVLLTGVAMIAFDVIGAVWVGVVEQEEMEKYFDQAEYWLRSWAAPVVRFFTLGYVNPRRMVHEEVVKALDSAVTEVRFSMWWLAVQALLRVAFGVSLWLAYAHT